MSIVESNFSDLLDLIKKMRRDSVLLDKIYKLAYDIKESDLRLFCSNGGGLAEHFNSELMNRMTPKRDFPIASVDLTAPSALITAIANDYSYNEVFSKQISGYGELDIDILLVCMSTSGESKNILLALQEAQELEIPSYLITGNYVDSRFGETVINIPSSITQRIQEATLAVIHTTISVVDQFLTEEQED